jgi:hypothetical protein
VRYSTARYTRDIDLCGTAASLDDAATALIAAVQDVDLGDFLRFRLRDKEDRPLGRASLRLRFDADLGGKPLSPVTIDLVVDQPLVGEPTRHQLISPVPLDGLDLWPQIRLYPIADHVADKICAIYELHGDGRTSTRYRDLVDLVLIALREPLDGRQVQTALAGEVDRRINRGTKLSLPAEFAVPGPGWRDGYRAEAALVSGLEEYRTLERAAVLAHALLDRLFAGEVVDRRWAPDRSAWLPV